MKIVPEMINEQLRNFEMANNFDVKFPNEESFRKAMTFANKTNNNYEKPTDIQYSEVWISRKKESKKLRLVIYKPLEPKENVPCVFWIHGGAYATGTPEQCEAYFRLMMAESNCVVISPDYRLSLEAPYPAALDDCYDALLWTKEHAKELGIRDDQIIVGGDSAGGGLAANIAVLARDKGEVNIAFQMPLYASLDDTLSTESMKDNNSPVVDESTLKYAWKMYLGELYGREVSPYAAAARTRDYSDLPPMISYVGGVDPLRDELIQYADNLIKAGIPVHYQVFEGCFHGFEVFCPDAEISKEAVAFFIEKFNYAVKNYFKEQLLS